MQIYILFLELYKEYGKKNNIDKIFYIQGCDPDVDMETISYFSNPNNDTKEIIKKNLYEFLYYEIYKNKDMILKKIHRALRYFIDFLRD